MSDENVLSDLLNELEELYDQGKVDDFCRSRPDLIPALVRRIAVLQRMEWLDKDTSSAPQQSSTGEVIRRRAPLKVGSVLLEPGARPLPKYRLIQEVGRGGFGEVWSAQSPFGRVAMKFCQGNIGAPDERKRVGIELTGSRYIKKIKHPHILHLYDMEIKDGTTLILVTELAEASLDTCFKKLRDEDEPLLHRCAYALHLLSGVACALDYLQAQHRLMHLDVKPSNLLMVGQQCKVGDFGTVSQMRPWQQVLGEVSLRNPSSDDPGEISTVRYKSIEQVPAQEALCRGVTLFSGAGAITPLYAPPEMLKQEKTSRSYDQYGLALSFCELVVGHIPFREHGCNLDMDRQNGKMDVTALPEGLRPVIVKALSPNPGERFQSCTEFLRAMRIAFLPLVRGDRKAEAWLDNWVEPDAQAAYPLPEAAVRPTKRRWKKWGSIKWSWSLPALRFSPVRLLDRIGLIAAAWFQARWKWICLHVDLLFRLALMLMFALAVAPVVKISIDSIRPHDTGPLFGKPAQPASSPQ